MKGSMLSMTNILNYLPDISENNLRLAVISCGEICYSRHLLTSSDGNISARLDNDRVLITAAGICKGRMDSDDLLIMDMAGKVIDSAKGRKPSSETPMHLEAYKQRPDVRAVIHSHPVFATALTVSGLEFPSDLLPEALLLLKNVPTTAFAIPSSHEDADAIRPFIREHNAILLRQHGSLTVGRNLEEALIHLERVEHVAEVFWRSRMLGSVRHISPEEQEKLRQKL
jgi:L-fuculose-phosphate aldolase